MRIQQRDSVKPGAPHSLYQTQGASRALVPVSNAIVGIDLADRKQMVVVTDHDSRVLARKTFRCQVMLRTADRGAQPAM
jgi:hypothetical protein